MAAGVAIVWVFCAKTGAEMGANVSSLAVSRTARRYKRCDAANESKDAVISAVKT